MRRNGTALLVTAAAALAATYSAHAQDMPVDMELILAVDVSRSVDSAEALLQRNGYVQALTDPQVIAAITSAPYGRIAVTYVEWAQSDQLQIVAGWEVIDGDESAHAFAARLAGMPVGRGLHTSISGVIRNVMGLFDANGLDGVRRVIDISGDGPNNIGGIVSRARDEAIAAGITVNGVAINSVEVSNLSLPDLDVYYEECVIGGPGAFVVAADGFVSFARAIRRKLILEIAGVEPMVLPARFQLAQTGQRYAPDCNIGELMRLNQARPMPPPAPR
jgi:hypothetical protein